MKHSIMRRFTSIFQTQDTNPNRIQTMEGLRGLAVTLVFWCITIHYLVLGLNQIRQHGIVQSL